MITIGRDKSLVIFTNSVCEASITVAKYPSAHKLDETEITDVMFLAVKVVLSYSVYWLLISKVHGALEDLKNGSVFD